MENKEILNMNIDEFEENLSEEEQKEFIIDNENLADWAIEKIKEEKQRLELFKNVTDSKIEQLKENLVKETERSASRNSYLLFKLNEYLDKVPCKTTKTRKTLKLPSGTIVRKLPKLEFQPLLGDKDLKKNKELLGWCKENAKDMVQLTETVTWGDLKKDLQITDMEKVNEETGELFTEQFIVRKSTGEIIDCLEAVESAMSVDVE